jgi:hypothetical protein
VQYSVRFVDLEIKLSKNVILALLQCSNLRCIVLDSCLNVPSNCSWN